MLTATKEQPKEMLPVFSKRANGDLALKPLVELIFEQLFDCGIREFCFVVGRGKRAMEDHFTRDSNFLQLLESRGKADQANDLLAFYTKVAKSNIFWVNQQEPRGFGDAVLAAESIVGGRPILVQAGDNHVFSPRNDHVRRLLEAQAKSDADATLLVRHVSDPRQYGVAEVRRQGHDYIVTRVVEKPEKPISRLAILPIYTFKPTIFDALRKLGPGKGGEIQLTDGIQGLIDRGFDVRAVTLGKDEFWLDVGTPDAYWKALNASHAKFARN